MSEKSCWVDDLDSGSGTSILIEGRNCRGFEVECVEDVRAGTEGVGSGMEARPALMPMEVWTHRRKGEE